MIEEAKAEVTLIDVLEAFDCTRPSPDNACVVYALKSTGASALKRLEAVRSAQNKGMLQSAEVRLFYGNFTRSELSELGMETLECHRFDERTRVTGKTARDILGDIEAEMAGLT